MKNEPLKNYQNEINKSAQHRSPKRIKTIALSQTQDNEIVLKIDFDADRGSSNFQLSSSCWNKKSEAKQIRTKPKEQEKIETNDVNLVNPLYADTHTHLNISKVWGTQMCYAL